MTNPLVKISPTDGSDARLATLYAIEAPSRNLVAPRVDAPNVLSLADLQKHQTENKDTFKRLEKWNPGMKKGIVLWGPVGTGKTAACHALIARWGNEIYRCKFISVAAAIQNLRNAIDDPDKTIMIEEKKLISPALLVLDDLGADKSTEWARERLFTLFEARFAAGRHTFFTMNLRFDEVSKIYGPRIADRMLEYCTWVEFKGKSQRLAGYKVEF